MNKTDKRIKTYSGNEERLNIASHALGFLLSVIALILLIFQAVQKGGILHLTGFTLFGTSMMVQYAASTLYHGAKDPEKRMKRKVFDHAAIYVLIAGTYTPLTLIALKGLTIGWVIFGINWGLALIGITLKIFFTGKMKILSTLMYVIMGWMIVPALGKIVRALPPQGFFWLLAGGIAYTVGAVLYSIKKIPFNHAIFHFFVLMGSIAHFISIYFYVINL